MHTVLITDHLQLSVPWQQ